MLSREDYIRYSLEINLFFLRLAKEHAIFAAASLPPRDLQVSCQLLSLKNSTEVLLSRAVMLSRGVISPEVLSSGELVTDLTLVAETKTQFLTGIPINRDITRMELTLKPGSPQVERPMLFEQVSQLNQQAIMALNTGIAFKEKLLDDILGCRTFSYIYPHMLSHIIAESRFFTMLLMKLEDGEEIGSINGLIAEELRLNWNKIMEDHAEFIRGYLDPSETELFEAADAFTKEFEKLQAETAALAASPDAVRESLRATTDLRNFKKQGTEGILACRVKSVIPPLLADHVTREANHYLRLLRTLTGMS